MPPVIGHAPKARPDMWIEGPDDLPDPDTDTDLDSEGIPWQASKTWHAPGPHPPPDIDITGPRPPERNSDDPDDEPPY
jgi:hypothetical protein